MMAELVQGQASMNQPGLKSDGLADALQRARQVTNTLGLTTHPFLVEMSRLDRAKALLLAFLRVVVVVLRSSAPSTHTLFKTH